MSAISRSQRGLGQVNGGRRCSSEHPPAPNPLATPMRTGATLARARRVTGMLRRVTGMSRNHPSSLYPHPQPDNTDRHQTEY